MTIVSRFFVSVVRLFLVVLLLSLFVVEAVVATEATTTTTAAATTTTNNNNDTRFSYPTVTLRDGTIMPQVGVGIGGSITTKFVAFQTVVWALE
jgi:hypothetical protein